MGLEVIVTDKFEGDGKQVVVKKNGAEVFCLDHYDDETQPPVILEKGDSLTVSVVFETSEPRPHHYLAYPSTVVELSDICFIPNGDPYEGPIPDYPEPGRTAYKISRKTDPRWEFAVTNPRVLAGSAAVGDGPTNVSVGDDDQ
jgi:hypothetical protein